MNTKICNKCGIEKPLSEFYNRTASKDGKDYYCKECLKIYQHTYSQKMRELHRRSEMLIAFRLLKRDIKNSVKKEMEEY